MNREAFEHQYRGDWRRFEVALEKLEKGRKGRDDADFPELYRRVCHCLALARSRLYGTDLEQELNDLVLRGHQQLYRRAGFSWRQAADFVVAGFPRLVRREARLVGLACLLFYGPFAAMAAGVVAYPELVYSVIDPEAAAGFQEMYDPAASRDRESQTDFMMFGFYIYNNVSIAFRTFASGILFGVGSIVFLVFNGLVIGTVFGHMVNAGTGDVFFPFVVGHGAFELTAIVLSGAAGLKLGLAVLDPGRLTRRQALLEAGREGVRMVYGIFGLLVLAAFVEAFWSSSTLVPAAVKYAVGAACWVAVTLYLLFAGRDRAA